LLRSTICILTGRDPGPPEGDHVVPAVLGGRHHEGNLMPACYACNNEDGVRIDTVLQDDVMAIIKAVRLSQHEARAYATALRQGGYVTTEIRSKKAKDTARSFWGRNR